MNEQLLTPILQRDPRYAAAAYLFVRDALNHTVKQLQKPRHVSGQELLDGIREYAIEQFGPLSMRVLSEWGIHTCTDFGHIVFNLVEEGLLGKTENDSLDDFSAGYDFHDAFEKPFCPPTPVACAWK